MTANTVDRKLAAKFAQARNSAELNVVEVAEQLQISEAEYVVMESGLERIPAAKVAQMARISNQPIAWFFDHAPRAIKFPFRK
ncbi:MAG: hypothetical protein AAGL97_04135 [Pseudomonadota bacterium]